ncbi:MAG: ammonium transporter, partial [Alphaproteobacteria bacterium]|nr:ammonium transporter [Alphaproteobacteria bacterium]
MEQLKVGTDVFFLLMGAAMVLAMHAGFAFLEAGTVRRKNQVNALVKILADFAVSAMAYFFIGYTIAYGVDFLVGAKVLTGQTSDPAHKFAPAGYDLVKFFFLMTFAAAVPAIISGGIAERARFWPQAAATAILVAFVYPLFEGMAWGTRFGFQDWVKGVSGETFHDFAGSVVVHAVGGWLALGAVVMLGARQGRYRANGTMVGVPPSNIPYLALGSWILCVGWFGFNVMSAQNVASVSGLVAMNSLMAMAGG